MTTTVTANPLANINNENKRENDTRENDTRENDTRENDTKEKEKEVNDFFGIDECAGVNGFEFASEYSRSYFKSAHKAISRCELWNWLQNYEPEEGRGFMFARDVPELDRLNEEMHKDPVNDGHSGASYGCTMRNMEFIAKNGYQAFKAEFNK